MFERKNGTGFTLSVNMTRAVLYVFIGGLSWFGEAPWWALPALFLNDFNWMLVWNSPKRLRLLREFYAQKQIEQVQMPGRTWDV